MFHLDIGIEVAFDAPKQTSHASRAQLEILVVEDDEADAFLIKRLLTAHPRIGNVIRAVDGVEALEMLGMGVYPDLAFIDINMPRMNGVTLVAEIGLKRLRFPMIVLTSAKALSDPTQRRLRRVDQVLSKPHSIDAFREILTTAVDRLDA